MAQIEYPANNEECPIQWPDPDMHKGLLSWGDEMEEWYERSQSVVTIEIVQPTPNEIRFAQLRKEWIRGTERLSRLSEIVLHPAYQQIIAMGSKAIPLILASLERQVDHWFWALKILNQGHDVAEGAETMPAAAELWLKWGREQGYLD
jgi:hypothetical protein